MVSSSGITFSVDRRYWAAVSQGIPRSQPRALSIDEFCNGGPHSTFEARKLGNDAESYSLDDFEVATYDEALNLCIRAAKELPEFLCEICLNPHVDFDFAVVEDFSGGSIEANLRSAPSVWWFKDIIGALHAFRVSSAAKAAAGIADTTISAQIFEDLDYCAQVKGLVLIEGEQRTGKTKAAETWAARYPGKAVYVRLESGRDELSFFRTIARAIGTPCNSERTGRPKTAQDIRIGIEDMLQERHLMLIIDEAHYLFPLVDRPTSAPARVDWLRTALVDHGVSVACVSTPQFDRQCTLWEKCLGWNAKQIKGRVKLQRLLPSELPYEDLATVARKMVPSATLAQIDGLVGFAQASDDYLSRWPECFAQLHKFDDFSHEGRLYLKTIVQVFMDF